ncbi:helix-turn-helix transcriptional regulator [Streptomyces sp. UG1]|uniref:helix-turn-helix transcriptional regulator n=1 Tax=Streptomyces sp. UG1 TaxID=3417652 RepID=UPI003CF482D0
MALKRHGLARRRRAVGLTQESLAEALRVERSTVARWESGKAAPQPWIRPRLAETLRVSAED